MLGFTLLETIVTLVIVSMIVVVLMQALRHSLSLRQRLLHHEQVARMDALQEQWFRDTVTGAIADLPDAIGAMRGDAAGFELVTAAPLSGAGLARVSWRLRGGADGASLVYQDPRWEELEVLRGPLYDARFEYLDAAGAWQAAWEQPSPPGAEAFDLAARDAPSVPPDALPRMLRLHARTAAGELAWLVAIPAHGQPPPMLRLEELGSAL